MQRFIRTRFLAAAVLALGAFGAAPVAHARSDLYFGAGAPPASAQPQPNHVPQRGHYGQDRYEDDRARHHVTHNWRSRGPYGDHDRDGIMNQNDRDRDGDGVRNRYDRFPDHPGRN